jgi:hypothetical protein
MFNSVGILPQQQRACVAPVAPFADCLPNTHAKIQKKCHICKFYHDKFSAN